MRRLQLHPRPSADSGARPQLAGMLWRVWRGGKRAKALVEEAAAQADAVGNPRSRSGVMRNLGLVCLARGEYGVPNISWRSARRQSRSPSKREIAWNLGVLASNQSSKVANTAASTS